jgi:16S rRNA processing protein RimM
LTGEDGGTGDLVVLGKVVDACGLRGAVKVRPFADDPTAWGTMPHWWLGNEDDAPDAWRRLRLIQCQVRSGTLIATLEGIDNRDAAESLRGLLVGAPREELPTPADGEYYWGDLLGLEVINERGQAFGRIAGLIATAANDVLRVVDETGKERLLPFVKTFVREVDIPEQRLRVDWEADW